MLKIENSEVVGWEHAIRGMRNPMNSWALSDSTFYGKAYETPYSLTGEMRNEVENSTDVGNGVAIGPEDLDLMLRLRKAGTDHRKFMRMIVVYLDITAPLYWWKEFDTYKVGTVANSCSTMHKIHEKEFTIDDFSHEHMVDYPADGVPGILPPLSVLKTTIDTLNAYRSLYLSTNTEPNRNCVALSEECCAKLKKDIWWQMIQLLPSSYNQKRTIILNYEVLANIYKSRRNHKLDEWHTLCDWIETLPYSKLITGKVE